MVYVSDTSVLRLFTDCCNELCLFSASFFVSYVWDTLVLNELRFCSTDEDFERAEFAVSLAVSASVMSVIVKSSHTSRFSASRLTINSIRYESSTL